MARSTLFAITTVAVALHAANSALADGDPVRGERIIRKCKACYTLEVGKHRVGQSLAGVLGRTAGTADRYKYSRAMAAYGATGVVWGDQTLDHYLENPRKVVKGTKMAFPGLKKPQDRTDLIAFLNRLTGTRE